MPFGDQTAILKASANHRLVQEVIKGLFTTPGKVDDFLLIQWVKFLYDTPDGPTADGQQTPGGLIAFGEQIANKAYDRSYPELSYKPSELPITALLGSVLSSRPEQMGVWATFAASFNAGGGYDFFEVLFKTNRSVSVLTNEEILGNWRALFRPGRRHLEDQSLEAKAQRAGFALGSTVAGSVLSWLSGSSDVSSSYPPSASGSEPVNGSWLDLIPGWRL